MADTVQARRRLSRTMFSMFSASMAPSMLSEVQDNPRPAPLIHEAPRQVPPPVRAPQLREVAARARTRNRVLVPAQTSACTVCLEDDVTFATTSPSNRCRHTPSVCTECLSEHIRSAVVGSGLVEVRCPAASCGTVLEYDEVILAARGDRALVDRFDSLLLRQALGADTTFVWCKNPDCGSGQYHEDGIAAPIITCRRCNTKSCFEHDVIWHNGVTCSEYDASRRPTNDATADYLQRFTKVCPGCTRMVEKLDGCDHMVCVRPGGCGYEFCWTCLADYRQIRQHGNTSHREGCMHRA